MIRSSAIFTAVLVTVGTLGRADASKVKGTPIGHGWTKTCNAAADGGEDCGLFDAIGVPAGSYHAKKENGQLAPIHPDGVWNVRLTGDPGDSVHATQATIRREGILAATVNCDPNNEGPFFQDAFSVFCGPGVFLGGMVMRGGSNRRGSVRMSLNGRAYDLGCVGELQDVFVPAQCE